MRFLSFAAALILLAAAPAAAQDYPTRPVTFVIPFTPGGAGDTLARMLAPKLEQKWGKSFIVENKPGAGGVIGANLVAKAPPDGYTLMIAPSAVMAINVTLFKNLSYDPVADFVPLALAAQTAFVLVVNPDLPIRSVPDLIAYVKARQGQLTYATAGPGTPHHLFVELLKSMTGMQIAPVAYRGSLPALNEASVPARRAADRPGRRAGLRGILVADDRCPGKNAAANRRQAAHRAEGAARLAGHARAAAQERHAAARESVGGGSAGLHQERDRTLGQGGAAGRHRGIAIGMPFASNKGVRIYYETYGDGSPMVLIHANPFDHRLFTYQIARFSASYRLLAVDIRGYGRSDKPETPFTLEDMAEDVLAACAQEKIARAVFMGVSVGSGMSLLIGLDHPEMAQAIILVGGSSFGGANIQHRVDGYTSAAATSARTSASSWRRASAIHGSDAGCSTCSPTIRKSSRAVRSRRFSARAKPATCAGGSAS
jgi:hypothetical protein